MLQRQLRLGIVRSVFTCLLLSIVCGCMAVMAQHTYSPGTTSGRSHSNWPANSRLPVVLGRVNCVMFSHPHCPCSLSTLAQIESMLTETGDDFELLVVIVTPPGVPEGWEQGAMTDRLARMPQFKSIVDAEGVEAKLFGAQTSGHLFVYDTDGSYLFDGGVTPGRGQIGPAPGLVAMHRALVERRSTTGSVPVFGCSLLGK